MLEHISNQKILLVEDDNIVQRVHIYFLKKLGYAVDVVSTGGAAIARAEQSDYFAVVLDLGLPDIDGETVFSSIKKDLPVIIVTAHGDPNCLSRIKQSSHAVEGFIKPVNKSDFKKVLDKIKEGKAVAA